MSLSRPAVTVSLQVLAATVSPNGRARHDLGTARKRRVRAIQILVGELVAYHRKRARTSHLSAATRFVRARLRQRIATGLCAASLAKGRAIIAARLARQSGESLSLVVSAGSLPLVEPSD